MTMGVNRYNSLSPQIVGEINSLDSQSKAQHGPFLLLPKSIPCLPSSLKWKTAVNERTFILEGPIFRFHDYGRTCAPPKMNGWNIKNTPRKVKSGSII